MKFKKLISSVIAMSTVAGMMSSVALADDVKKPTITATVHKYENDENNYVYGLYEEAIKSTDEYEDGIYISDPSYTAYLIEFGLENMPDLKCATKGSHVRFNGLEAYFSVDDAENIALLTSFKYKMIDNGARIAYLDTGDVTVRTVTGASGAYPTTSTVVNEVPKACAMFVVLKDDSKPVTFTAKSIAGKQSDMYTKISTRAYTGSTPGAITDYIVKDDAAAIVSSFTLGTKSSTTPKADIDTNGKVSFTDLKEEDKTIGADEQLIMDSANKEKSTFSSNSKVKIFYQKGVAGEEQSKLSSQTLFELLGIESTGTATGTVRFGVKAPSTMTGVFSFEIVEE